MVDWTKPIRTVEGHYPCRVLATDLKGDRPVAVRIDYGVFEEVVRVYKNGIAGLLVENIPEEQYEILYVYENNVGSLFGTTAGPHSGMIGIQLVGRLKVKLGKRFDE